MVVLLYLERILSCMKESSFQKQELVTQSIPLTNSSSRTEQVVKLSEIRIHIQTAKLKPRDSNCV